MFLASVAFELKICKCGIICPLLRAHITFGRSCHIPPWANVGEFSSFLGLTHEVKSRLVFGGDTIYGEPFSDEFHSRLRFNHRGVVACANAGSPNTNNSQFFMTLDRCDWLDKKHTIFGKVTGDTIYNLIKLGEIEAGADDRPLDPPKIISVEVFWNPFDDLFPREVAKSVEVPTADTPTKSKKKAKKELNLLSFGEEAEEEELQLATVKEKKIKSSHDVLEDPRLLKPAREVSELDPVEAKRRQDVKSSVRQALSGSMKVTDVSVQGDIGAHPPGSDEDEADFDNRMRAQIMERKRMHIGGTKPAGKDPKQGMTSTSTRKPPQPPSKVGKSHSDDDDDDDDDESDDNKVAKKEKLSIKKKGLGYEARAEFKATADLDMELLSPLEKQRLKFKQRKRSLLGREENTLARLERFTNVISKTKDSPSSLLEEKKEEDKDNADWLVHSLKFVVDASKQDDMTKNEDPNQYVVHDPLLEKGKEKFNKMQAKMKRRNREWTGNSVT